ncbi:hypothetical protein Rhal01_03209 [Rubritalea halochordaticola]|uniref:Integrase catalytic domain-containing protein n=1 Tax=Rubritalea halochordaticola TaxID=714537 RepID=A0ABP9V2Z0_9BACT
MKEKPEKIRRRISRKKGKSPKKGRKPKSKQERYPPEVRLRAVLLCIEGKVPHYQVAAELGVATSTLSEWKRAYKKDGAQGSLFRGAEPPEGGSESRSRLPSPVREKIVDLKKQNSSWGIRRIAQVLRRWFLMEASPETIRRTLNEEQLIEKKRAKPRRNRSKPRRFERATPNQMWQSDIFTFRLGGRNAYLIGYLDDYSRYITGAELFRSQTAEAVIELYRRAVGEYGVPREMLTDNGRQYATWRGTSRFQMH